MVIGGAEIFRVALARADRIYLTLVHAEPAGDTRFARPTRSSGGRRPASPCRRAPNDQFPADFIVLDRQG